MIWYKIINPSTEAGEKILTKCIETLEANNITELPDTPEGAKSMLFRNSSTRIFLQGDGVRKGYFILREDIYGQICYYKSSKFKY